MFAEKSKMSANMGQIFIHGSGSLPKASADHATEPRAGAGLLRHSGRHRLVALSARHLDWGWAEHACDT